MDFIVKIAEGFTGIVSAGGENLMSLITSILPNVLILLTFINALISLIGEERVMNFSRRLTRFRLLRYTLLPVMALFFLTNPMCYTMGKFVEEDEKPAFVDACFSFAHPITGLFPHANSAELFVWTGLQPELQRWENLRLRWPSVISWSVSSSSLFAEMLQNLLPSS